MLLYEAGQRQRPVTVFGSIYREAGLGCRTQCETLQPAASAAGLFHRRDICDGAGCIDLPDAVMACAVNPNQPQAICTRTCRPHHNPWVQAQHERSHQSTNAADVTVKSV